MRINNSIRFVAKTFLGNSRMDFPDLGGPTMESLTGTTGGGDLSFRYRRGLSMNFWRFSSVEWK